MPSLQRCGLNKAVPETPTGPVYSCPGSDISNVPASTTRSKTISGGPIKSAGASANRSRFGFRNRSFDTGFRYHGTMDVVDEEGRLSRESKDLQIAAVSRHSSLKGKEKEPLDDPTSRKSFSRTSRSVLNSKHGSFDFERPGLGANALQRSASNGTSTTVTSAWSRSGETLPVRESALGPGLAGVGTMQKDTSVKRGKEREEMAKEFQKQARAKKNVVMEDSEPGPPQQMNPLPAHSGNGQQTPLSTTTLGNSPSRASARRFFQSGNRNIIQHGLFPFESPISSLTRRATAAGATKEVSEPWDRRTEQGKEQEKERPVLKEQIKDQSTESKGDQSPKRSRLPVSTTKYTTLAAHIGSGVKGRSLDLNLGLSWAPSRVREDVLLKSSLFHRSMNASSSSRSLNSSAHDHGTTDSKSDDIASAKLKIGEQFKELLGEARYIRFKMCKFLILQVLGELWFTPQWLFCLDIYQFDAREIPFDGPTGIISKVDALLATVPTLRLDEKSRLMDNFVRIILQSV